MTNKITENKIELFTIKLLEKQGFENIYTPNIAPDRETPMRESFEDVILKEILQNSVVAKNATVQKKAMKTLSKGLIHEQ